VIDTRTLYILYIYECNRFYLFIYLWSEDIVVVQGAMIVHFLDLLDDDFNTIEPFYTKGGPWLQVFGHSNSLCARATRAITNHAPIGEYRLRFFPNEDFTCPCNNYPIESRRHILHECRRFNGYWNPRRDLLNHFIMFLIANPNAFAFTDK